MIAELKFLLKFKGNVKPVRHRKSSSLSQQSNRSSRSNISRAKLASGRSDDSFGSNDDSKARRES